METPEDAPMTMMNLDDITVLSLPNIITLVGVTLLVAIFLAWTLRIPSRLRQALHRATQQKERHHQPTTPLQGAISGPITAPLGSILGSWNTSPVDSMERGTGGGMRMSDTSRYQDIYMSYHGTSDSLALLSTPESAYIAPSRRGMRSLLPAKLFPSRQTETPGPKQGPRPLYLYSSATVNVQPYEKLKTLPFVTA